jgi:hypothetical protein
LRRCPDRDHLSISLGACDAEARKWLGHRIVILSDIM